jgi:AcrR family transcriptional regulator
LVSRDAIIDSALQEGLADFTMLAVAKRLSITHGALYRYFPSRDELAAAAVDTVVGAEQWDCSSPDWRALLTRFAEVLWALCHRVVGLAECTLQLHRTPPELDRVHAAHVAALEGLGIDQDDARAAVELISEELLLTNMLRCRLQHPPLAGTARPEHIRDVGRLDRKLQVILDGIERRTAPRAADPSP